MKSEEYGSALKSPLPPFRKGGNSISLQDEKYLSFRPKNPNRKLQVSHPVIAGGH